MRVKGRPASLGFDSDAVARQGETPIAIRGWLLVGYTKLLTSALKHKITVLLMAFIILVLLVEIWLLGVGLEKPVEFFPTVDPRALYVNIDPPEGADLDYNDRIVRQVEMAISGAWPEGVLPPLDQYPLAYRLREHRLSGGRTFEGPTDMDNIDHIYAKSALSSGFVFEQNLPNHLGIQFVDFVDRTHSTNRDLETIRQRVRHIPGARVTVELQEEGPPTGAPINIEISGENFEQLGAIAEKVREVVAKVPHVENVQDDYVAGLPSVRVRIDRQKAALFGLSTNAIGFALKTAYNGLDISTFYEGDDDYDIVVMLSEDDRRVTDVLHKLMIPTATGQLVPLTTLAEIDYSGSIGNIVRINHERTVTVKADVDEEKVPGAVARAQAEQLLNAFQLPPGYQMKFTGEFESQQEAEEFLFKAFLIAILLIFFILVSLFNSISQPVIILTSVILSLGGAFLGLYVNSLPFGIIMCGVGVISLAGVVVNNAIVLIDYTNKLRQRGMALMEAVVSAGATRLRPVLLTAITTILGLLPMVTGISYDFHIMSIAWSSESTLWWRSMAIVVIFGLLVATILTLVVVPTLYALIEVSKKRLARGYKQIKAWYWRPFSKA
jgi:multidrug efflux pump subunit AcrB